MQEAKELLNTLKDISAGVQGATPAATFTVGTVVSPEPIKIKVDQKLFLENDDPVQQTIYLPERLTRKKYKIKIKGNVRFPQDPLHPVEMELYEGEIEYTDIELKAGDKVLLLKARGGNSYAVLDRIEKKEG